MGLRSVCKNELKGTEMTSKEANKSIDKECQVAEWFAKYQE